MESQIGRKIVPNCCSSDCEVRRKVERSHIRYEPGMPHLRLPRSAYVYVHGILARSSYRKFVPPQTTDQSISRREICRAPHTIRHVQERTDSDKHESKSLKYTLELFSECTSNVVKVGWKSVSGGCTGVEDLLHCHVWIS